MVSVRKHKMMNDLSMYISVAEIFRSVFARASIDLSIFSSHSCKRVIELSVRNPPCFPLRFEKGV